MILNVVMIMDMRTCLIPKKMLLALNAEKSYQANGKWKQIQAIIVILKLQQEDI